MAIGNSLTRINNNQISDAISGNTQFGINANTKVQPYSVTSGLLANNINYQSNLTITGNLSVSGNTTSIDTTVVTIEDPMITLASTQTGAPTVDIGFIGERGTSNNVAFVWDESSQRFVTVYTNSAPGNVNINILSYADLQSSNVTIQGLLSANTVSLSGNVTSSLNVTGDITGGNIYSPATISATGSMYAGNIYVPNGNLTATGVVSSNVYAGLVQNQVAYTNANGALVGNGNLTYSNNTLSTTGNIVAGINANAGNVYIGSFTTPNAMVYAGINGLVSEATGILTDGSGNLSATGNISAVGVLATDLYSLSTTTPGEIFYVNDSSGLVTAGSGLITDGAGNLTATGSIYASQAVSAGGNVTGGNILTNGYISATGNITTYASFNGASLSLSGNVISDLKVTGNATAANVYATNNVSAAGNVNAYTALNSQSLSLSGNVISDLKVTGNATANNLSAVNNINAATISTSGNVQLGNISTGQVSASGNITVGAGSYYVGNGSQLTGVTASSVDANNLTGNTLSANVVNSSLTTVGTLANLSVTDYISAGGNVTGGNILSSGIISTSGNIAVLNISADGNVNATLNISATANVTGGNISTGGTLSVLGNTTLGNLKATYISSTGNIDSNGNVNVQNNLNASNVYATTGDVSAAGNITAGSSGNVTGANVVTPNVVTSGQLNITTGNGLQFNVTGNINAGNTYITNLAGPPVNGQDAANKTYVDTVAQGLSAKEAVQVASTTYLANASGVTNVVYNNGTAGVGATLTITTTSQLSIDGESLATIYSDYGANSRILIKSEGSYTDSSGAWNGIYTITSTGALSTVLTRTSDFDVASQMYGAFTFVQEGTINGSSGWVCTNNEDTTPITVGTTVITFSQFSGAGTYSAGNALSLTGTQFNVLFDNATVGINSSNQLSVFGNITLVNPTLGNASFSTLSAIGGQSGNITSGNISANGTVNAVDVVASGNVSATGYLYGGYAYVSSVGNTSVVYGNTSRGLVSSANLTYVDSTNTLSTGNLSISGNITTGNISAGGNIFDGNLSNTQVVYSGINGQLLGNTGFTTDGSNVSITGMIYGGNLSVSGNIIDASLISTQVVYSGINGQLLGNAGFTTDGTNISVQGMVFAGNISVSGNIIDASIVNSSIVWSQNNKLVGNSGLTTDGANLSVSGNIYSGNLSVSGNIYDTGIANTSVVFIGAGSQLIGNAGFTTDGANVSVTGNISAYNISLAGNIEAGFTANEVVYSDSNGNLITSTSLGYDGTTLSATSNIYGGNISSYNIYDLNVGANQITYGNTSGNGLISSNAGLTTDGINLTATGTITGGNITTTGGSGNITGANVISAITFTATGNVYAVEISTSGNITIANPGGYFIGDGGFLSNVVASSVDANTLVGNTLSANVLYSSLTSVGTLTQLSVSGEVDVGGNIIPTTDNTYYIGNAAQAWNTTYTDNISAGTSASVLTVNPTSATQSFAVNGTNANVLWVDGSTNTVEVGNSTVTVGATFAINATDSFLVPVGNSAQRPTSPTVGMQRWNSTLSSLEMWSGSAWETIGATNFTVIQNEQFNGDGTTTTFTLALAQAANQPQTTDSCIVTINGVVQIPTTAYSVSVYTLTFTEAPEVADVIDVREITTTTTVSALADPTGNTIFTVNLGNAYLSNGNLTLAPGFYFEGDGSQLTNLSANVNATHIVSGSSNVAIATPSGNVSFQVSGVGNVINIGTTQATMKGNFIPSSNNAYSLGSATNVWQELYVSNSSIYIGGTALTASANGLAFGGNAVVTANPTGTSSTTGNIQVTGDITANSIYAVTWFSAAGNITAPSVVGGVITGSSLSVNGAVSGQTGSLSGNITGGNILTSGLISATANIIGGNILTSGLISVTGNASIGNLTLSGDSRASSYSASGNISGGNFILAAGGNITTTAGTNGNVVVNPDGTGVFLVTSITPAVFANTTAATSSITGAVTVAGGVGVAGNIVSGALITATGNIVGGNIRTAGLISATGNVTSGNVLTAGLVSATGNITGSYILGNGALLSGLTPTKIFNGTSEANIGASNGNANITINGTSNVVVVASTGLYVTGVNSVSGNITGANMLTGGLISATGNVNANSIVLVNTVTANSIVAGTQVTTTSGGGNLILTEQSPQNQVFNGTASQTLTLPSTTSTGLSYFVNNNSSGNIVVKNSTGTTLYTVQPGADNEFIYTGSGVYNWDIHGFIPSGATYGSALFTVGTTNGVAATAFSASGNVNGGNVLSTGVVSSSGNAIHGNIVTAGLISATGNIVTAGNFVGNGAALSNIVVSSVSGNVIGPQANVGIIAGSYTWTFDNTGNLTLPTNGDLIFSANTTLGSQAGSNGNITVNPDGTGQFIVTAITPAQFGNNVSVAGNVATGGLTVNGSGVVTGNLQVQGNLTYNNLTNITTSNLVFGLANTATGISANGAGFVVGNTNQATFLYNYSGNTWQSNIGISAAGNIVASNIQIGGLISSNGNSTAANYLTSGLISATGNITGGNLTVNTTITAGSLTVGAITSNNTITGNNVNSNGNVGIGSALQIIGSTNTLQTNNGSAVQFANRVNFNQTGTSIVASGNISGTNIQGSTLSASGNVNGGNLILAAGGQVTTPSGSNGNVSINPDGTGQFIVTSTTPAAFGNTLSVTGNVVTASYFVGNVISVTMSASGNIYGGNIINAGISSVTGNLSAGNIITAGLISATGNLTVGNIATAGIVTATGNITGGNVLSNGLISTTGNATHGNIATAGQISVTGNIFGNIANVTTVFAGSPVANLYNIAAVNAVGNSAGNTITALNLINTGGGAGSGSGLDFYTYTGNTQNPPEARIFAYDNGDYSANISFATKIPGASNNALATRMTLTSSGALSVVGNVYAGNIILSGQQVSMGVSNPAYAYVFLNTTTGSFGSGTDVVFDTVSTSNNLPYSTSSGLFTLTAGVTYELEASLYGQFSQGSGVVGQYYWVDSSNNQLISGNYGQITPMTTAYNDSGISQSSIIYTPSQNISIKLRFTNISAGTMLLQSGKTWAKVKQLNPAIAVQATATGTINNQFINVTNSSAQNVAASGTDIIWDTNSGSSGIPYNSATGVFTLTAGVTYNIIGMLSFQNYSANGYVLYQVVDATSNTAISNQIVTAPYNTGYNEVNNLSIDIVYTPPTNQTIKFRVTGGTGGLTAQHRGSYFSLSLIHI